MKSIEIRLSWAQSLFAVVLASVAGLLSAWAHEQTVDLGWIPPNLQFGNALAPLFLSGFSGAALALAMCNMTFANQRLRVVPMAALLTLTALALFLWAMAIAATGVFRLL